MQQFSPRLVEGANAVMGAGGTVYFANGAYGYTNQVPVLTAAAAAAAAATHADPGSATVAAAAGAQAPTAFQQHTATAPTAAVSHAAQPVTGCPTMAGGYPTLMYPQAVYFPQQYQQYQPQVRILRLSCLSDMTNMSKKKFPDMAC